MKPRKREEAELPVLFIKSSGTEEWIRNAVFRGVPPAEKEGYMRNLTGALARDNPKLLYEGVKDESIRTKLGILYNMLSETRTPGIYEITPAQRHKFWDMVEGYEETARGRSAMMLTPKTEEWLKTHIFWDKKEKDTEIYLRNLNNALREGNPALLYSGISSGDKTVRSTLGVIFTSLTAGKPKKGVYSLTEGKKDEIAERLERYRTRPEAAVAKVEGKKRALEEEKPPAQEIRARPAPVAARVPFEEEKESEGARSIFKIETAAGKPPTTFYIEAPKLSDDEMRRFRATFNANHAEALASLAKMPDVKLYVAHGEEWREVEQKEMLAMLRQESERLKRVTHTAGESAIGSA